METCGPVRIGRRRHVGLSRPELEAELRAALVAGRPVEVLVSADPLDPARAWVDAASLGLGDRVRVRRSRAPNAVRVGAVSALGGVGLGTTAFGTTRALLGSAGFRRAALALGLTAPGFASAIVVGSAALGAAFGWAKERHGGNLQAADGVRFRISPVPGAFAASAAGSDPGSVDQAGPPGRARPPA
jgi:hypothetical protein